MHVKPVLLDCNFVVDSGNVNGLGIKNLKGPMIKSAYLSLPSLSPGAPNMKSASSFGILGASAVTNTGSSVVNGDLGIFPGTSVTGFPPGVITGVEDVADARAHQAQIDALAVYTLLAAHASTVIPSALDGQTLTAGYYSFASGAATLATSADGTLILSGSASDLFVIKTASTLTTGAGGIPTITLSGGAVASNVFWIVGSSATINSGSAGVFQGTILANTSITDTMGGTVNGRLIALNGAVTLSAATVVNAPSSTPPGLFVIQFEDNYNGFFAEWSSIASPNSGSALKIDNSELIKGAAYVISTVGSSSAAAWHALGVPLGVVPAVGVAFIAASAGAGANSSSSRVMAPAQMGSGVASIEQVGLPNMTMSPQPSANQGFGGQVILQARDYAGLPVNPVDGSLIALMFYLSDSSVQIKGE